MVCDFAATATATVVWGPAAPTDLWLWFTPYSEQVGLIGGPFVFQVPGFLPPRPFSGAKAPATEQHRARRMK